MDNQLTGLLSRRTTAASDWLARADLPAPPLTQSVLQALAPLAPHLFASDGAAQWARSDPAQAFQTWSAHGASLRGDAVLGVVGSGLHARLRCYSAGPEVVLFIQRDWSPVRDSPGTASGNTPSMAIEGAFTLARLLLERAAAARNVGRWPEGQALVLVDDTGSGRLQRWGWAPTDRAATPDDLVIDSDAYLSALMAVRAL
jgi:hypothetical protein